MLVTITTQIISIYGRQSKITKRTSISRFAPLKDHTVIIIACLRRAVLRQKNRVYFGTQFIYLDTAQRAADTINIHEYSS